MNNQEAIEQLKLNNPFMAGKDKELFSQAIDKGIEALENQKSVIEELEKIKAEITACTQQEEGEVPACINYGIKLSTEIVEKHIAELKGENNE